MWGKECDWFLTVVCEEHCVMTQLDCRNPEPAPPLGNLPKGWLGRDVPLGPRKPYSLHQT